MIRRLLTRRSVRRSERANDAGRSALHAERLEDAERALREAVGLHPENAAAWHNLGILYKRTARWPEAREACARAIALDATDLGAAWNLGIAGTALGDWDTARRGWRAAGVEIPEGTGPVEMELGPTPIRVSVEEAPEVVWCRRIDPARAVLLSIPSAGCNRRHGDLLLHDGDPAGYRMLQGREVAVFNELAVLEASADSTWTADVEAPGADDVTALERAVEESGGVAEDWTASFRLLCKACSEGRPHDHEDHPADEPGGAPWKRTRRLAFATRDPAALRAALRTWAGGAPGRVSGELELAVPGAGTTRDA